METTWIAGNPWWKLRSTECITVSVCLDSLIQISLYSLTWLVDIYISSDSDPIDTIIHS